MDGKTSRCVVGFAALECLILTPAPPPNVKKNPISDGNNDYMFTHAHNYGDSVFRHV